MFCEQELKGSTGTLTMDDIRKEAAEEMEKEIRERLKTYSDPFLKPADFKRWEKYVNHLISEGKSFENIVQEVRFEKMGDQKVLQEEMEAMKRRRYDQEMDEAHEKAREKQRKKEIEAITKEEDGKKDDYSYFDGKDFHPKREMIEAIAKEEDENNISLTESRLCVECRGEFKYERCKKCNLCFCKKCFEGHECIGVCKEKMEEVSSTADQDWEAKTEEGVKFYTKLNIDSEFKNLIPALSKEEYNLLEKNIIQNGCLDSLKIWEGLDKELGYRLILLVDGHNRYKICRKHKIEFKVKQLEFAFDEREKVRDWIISNQLGRRNLTDSSRAYFIGKLYESRKKQEGGDKKSQEYKKSLAQNDPVISTADIIAKEQKVSPATIKRNDKFAQAVDTIASAAGQEVKQKILNEEVKLTKKAVLKVARMTPEEQKHIMEQVKAGKDIDEVLEEEKPQIIPELKEILKEKKLRLSKRETSEISEIEPEEQKQIAEQIKSGNAKHVTEALFCIHHPDTVAEVRAEREKELTAEESFAKVREEEKQEQVKEEPLQEEKTESISDDDFNKLEKGLNELAVGLKQLSKKMDEDKNSKEECLPEGIKEQEPVPEFPEEEPDLIKESNKEDLEKQKSGLLLKEYLRQIQTIRAHCDRNKIWDFLHTFDFRKHASIYFNNPDEVIGLSYDTHTALLNFNKFSRKIASILNETI